MNARGFILQPTYRIESGWPVVHIYGRLESGGSFLIRHTRQTPCFYVRENDRLKAAAAGAAPLTPAGKVTFSGEPVSRVEVRVPQDAPALRDRLIRAGIACYEADVRFAMRYLIDRGIRGSLEIRGSPRRGEGVDAVFDDPEVSPADWTPKLSVLSLDIETDPQARRLLAISLYGCGASEVLLLTPEGATCPEGAVPFRSERELIAAFCGRVRQLDPDVLTGWNVVDFDLAVLSRLSEKLGVPLELGRGPGAVRVQPMRGFRGSSSASVAGRVVLDGIDLMRGAFIRMEEYSLDFVSREILGEGKTITGPSRALEILRAFKNDRDGFVRYSLRDARLVAEILRKLRLVELAVERARLTGMPPDRVSASIASFDFLYLSELSRRDIVAPSVGASGWDEESTPAALGGHVLEPDPGLYHLVLVFDFKSLYPSLIRTFQIDPLGYLPRGGNDSIVAPNGASFRREPGILTGLLDRLFERREAAKAAGDAVSSQAIKILMNSMYGVLGAPACRFHNPNIANAITSFGREILLWSKGRTEELGYRVLYGDTDSLFVLSGLAPSDGNEAVEEAGRTGAALARRLNTDLAEHIQRLWRVDSRLELQFETLYLRLLLLPLRHGTGGARKRYAGLVEKGGRLQVQFTGLEIVRRDWTDLAKTVQRELYERLFSDRPVEDYMRQVVADLREGRLDHLLVYRKALRKDIEEYTATTPPHVAAARKMAGPPKRLISYIMTADGPEPAGESAAPPDHEHYVQKQIRPVAEPVLLLLGLDFDLLIGDRRQLELF